MNTLLQRLVLTAVVLGVSFLWVEPAARRSLGYGVSEAKATVAQRYPLRARSNNFYNRSKISYTRGK